MKVLHITPPVQSGVAEYALNFQKAMRKYTNVRINTLPEDRSIDRIWNKPRDIFSVKNQIKQFKENNFPYDLIHVELGANENRELYYAHFLGELFPTVPICLTVHDPPFLVFSPMLFMGVESMPKAVRGIRKLLDLTLGKFWENLVIKRTNKVFALSKKGKNVLVERFGMEISDKIIYLPFPLYNDISSDELSNCKRTYNSEKTVILFCGFFGRLKGIEILIDAYNLLLKEEKYRKNTELWLCGGQLSFIRADAYPQELQRMVNRLELTDKIKFFGLIPSNEIPLIIDQSNILVLPYKKSKAYPMSAILIRGMESGVPIIASNVRTNSEEIIENKTGLLFNDGNSLDLYKKLKILIDKPDLQEKFGRAARCHVIKEHSWQIAAETVYQNYREVLKL